MLFFFFIFNINLTFSDYYYYYYYYYIIIYFLYFYCFAGWKVLVFRFNMICMLLVTSSSFFCSLICQSLICCLKLNLLIRGLNIGLYFIMWHMYFVRFQWAVILCTCSSVASYSLYEDSLCCLITLNSFPSLSNMLLVYDFVTNFIRARGYKTLLHDFFYCLVLNLSVLLGKFWKPC